MKFINVEIKTPKKNIIAVIDENQIRQALQNIISNAINSMLRAKKNNNTKYELSDRIKRKSQ